MVDRFKFVVLCKVMGEIRCSSRSSIACGPNKPKPNKSRPAHRSPITYALLFSLSFALKAQANEGSESSTSATIDFVKGYATVFPKQDSKVALFAKRNMQVEEGDLLITGQDGFISISFHSNSVMHIQPSSEILLEKINCATGSDKCSVVIDAKSGAITSDVVHQSSEDAHFTIKTPYASAAVRGTVFDVDISNGRLLAGVTEGLVSISAPLATVEVPENFGLEVVDNQPPSALKKLPPQPSFVPGAARYESRDQFQWNDISTATRYIVSLYDASGLTYSTTLEEPLHQMQSLNVGRYTAQIRAVDAEGFKGPAAEKVLDIVTVVPAIQGPIINAAITDNSYELAFDMKTSLTNLLELNFSTTNDFERLTNLDVPLEDRLSGERAANTIYVRARGVLSNTEVTPFGPTIQIPARL